MIQTYVHFNKHKYKTVTTNTQAKKVHSTDNQSIKAPGESSATWAKIKRFQAPNCCIQRAEKGRLKMKACASTGTVQTVPLGQKIWSFHAPSGSLKQKDPMYICVNRHTQAKRQCIYA